MVKDFIEEMNMPQSMFNVLAYSFFYGGNCKVERVNRVLDNFTEDVEACLMPYKGKVYEFDIFDEVSAITERFYGTLDYKKDYLIDYSTEDSLAINMKVFLFTNKLDEDDVSKAEQLWSTLSKEGISDFIQRGNDIYFKIGDREVKFNQKDLSLVYDIENMEIRENGFTYYLECKYNRGFEETDVCEYDDQGILICNKGYVIRDSKNISIYTFENGLELSIEDHPLRFDLSKDTFEQILFKAKLDLCL